VKRASTLSAILALMLLVVAACSSGSSPTATTSEAAATQPPTPEPSVAASQAALPSFGEGAGDLADVLPEEIAGLEMTYQYAEGEDVFGSEGLTEEGQEFLDRVGAESGDVATAFGFAFDAEGGTTISILAIRVDGADSEALRQAFIETIEAEGDQVGTATTVGGKSVQAYGGEATEDQGYLYVSGDVVFAVGGSPASALEEALAALP
jgi:hypothetical protein